MMRFTGLLLMSLMLAGSPSLAGGHCEGTTLVDTYGYALLEESRVLPDVTLRAVVVRFCLMRVLQVQIWEKTSGNRYRLVWRRDIAPRTLDRDVVHNIPEAESIRLRPLVHRLGLYIPDKRDLPVFAQWGTPTAESFRTFYSETEGPFNFAEYGFMTDLINPIAFNITVCGQPDCAPRPIDAITTTTTTTTTPTTTTTTTTTPTTTTPEPPPQATCQPSDFRSTGSALLEADRPLPSGELRGVRIRTCQMQPYVLQVWDKVPFSDRYRLIWHMWIMPRVADGSTQIFRLESYLVSSPNYRAGVQLHPFMSVSVPFPSWSVSRLMESAGEVTDFDPCDEVTFRQAAYSWDLSVEFCVTADCTPTNVIGDMPPTVYDPPCQTSTALPTTTPTIPTTSFTTTLLSTSPQVSITSQSPASTTTTNLPTSTTTKTTTSETTSLATLTTATTSFTIRMTSTLRPRTSATTTKIIPGNVITVITEQTPLEITTRIRPPTVASTTTTTKRPVTSKITTTTKRPITSKIPIITKTPTITKRPINTKLSTTTRRPTTTKRPTTTTSRPRLVTTTTAIRKTVKTTTVRRENTVLKFPTPRTAAASGTNSASGPHLNKLSIIFTLVMSGCQCILSIINLWV